MIHKSFQIAYLAFVLILAQMAHSFAQQATTEPVMSVEVQAWYVALTKVYHRGFNKLIDDDAKIELRDLGITQTKKEFLDSLDEWEDATKGAIILTQTVSSIEGKDVVEVCYRFESNEQLIRETFEYTDGKITHVIQELIATKCEGF